MRLSIHAVGRMKAGPERDLVARYLDRLAKTGSAVGMEFSGVAEIAESQARSAEQRMREEADKLEASLGDAALVLLDERGKNMTSPAFADYLSRHIDGGRKSMVVAIGGADGHDPGLRGKADLLLSFGALTWPHQLVRVLLAEQLYRASTILSNHPYHRI
ncbi:MAG: 23S rRNA (pseudouridine(1915)-N(3))-methyltransferase RlmH [Aliihoeflea sp.]|uniref:23S rRNA (pseudouridine(1915)-N(3))-methyltransferase RlmH n=1 Tax=Aliihoeflea sp. 40Bstr573 TaxID=2696467 RepID=UPI002095916B|nr:23S rRNA (pseudouridine(1915)-N(3))-methyltransferase RlmH [Aliihoeflea sp. 40Bstr573]MCO6387110.1 23S rRNA (pseudouridine(1915)-N(3))-methyltransferase RlmH [Aliihoeflea sp. 40Bstr573]